MIVPAASFVHSDVLVQVAGQSLTATLVSAFGALAVHLISMLGLFRLRRSESDIRRPFRTPLYPWLPIFALSAVGAVLAATAWLNIRLAITFIGLLALSVLFARLVQARMAVELTVRPADALHTLERPRGPMLETPAQLSEIASSNNERWRG